MLCSSQNHRKIRAFTLIELLVVISIIAMLIALLLPALQNARAMAQSVSCLSQEQQISVAMVAFSNDYDGYLPPNLVSHENSLFPSVSIDGRWFFSLNPYVGKNANDRSRPSIFLCPTNDPRSSDEFALWLDWGYLNNLQTMPRWQEQSGTLRWTSEPRRANEVSRDRALIADTDVTAAGARLLHVFFSNAGLADSQQPYGVDPNMAQIHLGGVNVLWGDMSASHMLADDINRPGSEISTGSYFWK